MLRRLLVWICKENGISFLTRQVTLSAINMDLRFYWLHLHIIGPLIILVLQILLRLIVILNIWLLKLGFSILFRLVKFFRIISLGLRKIIVCSCFHLLRIWLGNFTVNFYKGSVSFFVLLSMRKGNTLNFWVW